MLRTQALALGLMVALLGGCSDGAPSDGSATSAPASSGEVKKSELNGFARSLVKEDGCDPRIAKAMAPFESDYGECTMNKLTDICGEENFDRGVALIPAVREQQPGLNPWLWACSRNNDVRTAMFATCKERYRQSDETCDCAVDAFLASESDSELVEWFSIQHAFDTRGAEGKYQNWVGYGPESRMTDLSDISGRYSNKLEECGFR
ncbi:hypothetical protein [Henriciella litoralis]|uniref:hypothetical protein n=1 Tax=Henriciella litoralis TaxID=568102 RepID=UPI00111C91A3|nr:hypothetical protein [Henriciella litoralis]